MRVTVSVLEKTLVEHATRDTHCDSFGSLLYDIFGLYFSTPYCLDPVSISLICIFVRVMTFSHRTSMKMILNKTSKFSISGEGRH